MPNRSTSYPRANNGGPMREHPIRQVGDRVSHEEIITVEIRN